MGYIFSDAGNPPKSKMAAIRHLECTNWHRFGSTQSIVLIFLTIWVYFDISRILKRVWC